MWHLMSLTKHNGARLQQSHTSTQASTNPCRVIYRHWFILGATIPSRRLNLVTPCYQGYQIAATLCLRVLPTARLSLIYVLAKSPTLFWMNRTRTWNELTAICDINQKATFATSQTIRQTPFIYQLLQGTPAVIPWLYFDDCHKLFVIECIYFAP
jgi:hypothetical protein